MSAQFNVALYKDNPNNRTIAGSTTGAVGSPTEPLFVETLKNGTITTSGTTVTGSGTQFTTAGTATQVSVGDYIMTTDGEPVGIVATVVDADTLTLTASSITAIGSGKRFFACSGTRLLKSESILLRITPVKNGSASVVVPDIANLRLPISLSKDNAVNALYLNLALTGNLGVGDFTGSGANQTVTIEPISCGRLVAGNNVPCFPASFSPQDQSPDEQARAYDALSNTVANFPSQLWYVVNPFGATTTNLAANTEYSYFVTDVLPELTLTTANLQNLFACYSVLGGLYVRKF